MIMDDFCHVLSDVDFVLVLQGETRLVDVGEVVPCEAAREGEA